MNFRHVAQILGIVAFFTGAMMVLALPWGLERFGGIPEYEASGMRGLVFSIFTSFALGAFLCIWGRKSENSLTRKELLAAVPFSWFLVTILSALPYLFSGTCCEPGKRMGIVDVFFESASGITTTGATVLSELEDPALVSRSILFWRSETLFVGGLGIMVFFVAFLGYGSVGKQILTIEKGSGTISLEERGNSRSRALCLAGIYVGLVVLLAVLLHCCGLSAYDSLCHAFSTVATGGFSNYNASIGHFAGTGAPHAFLIESILLVFMILGGTNFVLLYHSVRGNPGELFKNKEWQTYLGIILFASLIVFVTGHFAGDFDAVEVVKTSPADSSSDLSAESAAEEEPEGSSIPWYQELHRSIFHVASIMTGTGFTTDEYEKWNAASLMVFLIVMCIGGCVGGASGGVKVLRVMTVFKTGAVELEKTYRPNAVRKIRIGGALMDDARPRAMIIYVLFFFISVLTVTMIILATEKSSYWAANSTAQSNRLIDLFSSTLSMFANVGPGFGIVGANENYSILSLNTKLIYSFAMLFGRLEIYLPLLMFSPSFWKK